MQICFSFGSYTNALDVFDKINHFNRKFNSIVVDVYNILNLYLLWSIRNNKVIQQSVKHLVSSLDASIELNL